MSRNIRTFRDIGNNDDGGPDSDDSGADAAERGAPQEFYAGSGQAVQGPRGAAARGPDSEAHIRRILQAAEVVQPEGGEAPRGRPSGRETISLTLHLWSDGLSIEDGPLMSRQDPRTIEFLESVGKGEIPPSLVQQYPGKEIDFKVNRHHEEYVAPKMKPFGGSGVRLGNVVPTVLGQSSSSATTAGTSSATTDHNPDHTAENEAKQLEDAKKELSTNMNEPTTNVRSLYYGFGAAKIFGNLEENCG
ncbi:SEP domain-containing protein [Caenorhabditis elegans]|uniref:SEP domain-containing protein n=1 Tax=Caenorhabditis elegans TaxID=6239 RepID=U4PBA6_CAEEL|nr:SEP domain-containing protein [Caenorhabditis elegans]CDH93022.1 SEP domain-containing protein [Caenorhabditis elegans]|eukprot:NP_001294316.1 UBX domain-containing protein 2 [Caenorhabditis elegans]